MKLEQAARSALEALREFQLHGMTGPKSDETITALREALSEQAEPINKFDSIISWANSCPIKQPIKAEQATVSGGVCGGCAKKAADGWALYCVECWEKAEQKPIGVFANVNALTPEKGARWEQMIDSAYDGVEYIHLYAAPVRTKDLTNDEIDRIAAESIGLLYIDFARAVIAADREKNRGTA